MLSIAKLAPGQERYYERSVAGGLDDYYAGRGEAPGVWVGAGADALELAGEVGAGDLSRIIAAVDPRTGRQLRRHAKPRTITVQRYDPQGGRDLTVAQELKPVAGFDLVFSAPKSVSIIHALGSDAARRAVAQAHEAAWRAALAYLEAEAAVVRSGKAGVVREHATGIVAAAYTHRTSRAQDPQLHTHVVLANVAASPDGRWRALDGTPILQTYRLAAGYLYQAQLRHHLTATLGIRWTPIIKGLAEVSGFDAPLLEAFSTRRTEVLEQLAATGGAGWHDAQRAAHETRDRRDPIELELLRGEWRARAAKCGLSTNDLDRLAIPNRVRARPPDSEALERLLTGPLGLTSRSNDFGSPDVVMAVSEHAPHGIDARSLLAIRDRVMGATSVERLTAENIPGRPDRFTTADLLDAEQRSLRFALDRTPTGRAATATAIATAIREHRLGPDQAAVVRTCAETTQRVQLVVGPAGAGKTTAMRALVSALAVSGIATVGAAPTGTAARQLEAEAGIRSSTLHRLLADVRLEGGLPRGCVVIVDEAAMVETRLLAPLLKEVAAADARCVLLGDHHQLPSVGAGGIFGLLVDQLEPVALTRVRRQRDSLEVAALTAIREGRGREYVTWALQNQRVVVEGSPIGARARLLADWWADARTEARGSIMIAHRRRDVADLNRVARSLVDAAGLLGQRTRTARGLELAVGEQVICRRNDPTIGVTNGSRGTITAIHRHGCTVATADGLTFELPRAYLDAGHVAHAYAITGHASQGATFERGFVLAPQVGSHKEWGYVALSRARSMTRLYASAQGVSEPSQRLRDLAQAIERSSQRRLQAQARRSAQR